jgi:hypothetical protein
MHRYPFVIALLAALAGLTDCSSGSGGSSGGPPATQTASQPTYYKDVASTVDAKCAGCHRDGGIAPFSLLDPATAVQMAPAIAAATQTRTMPPMPVNNDGSCNTYANARWLSDDEIALFKNWALAGAPLGDPADAPPPPVDNTAKLTGQVAASDTGVDYTPTPPQGAADDYHCFILDPGIAADTFVTGYDIEPGDARVVHHVALYAPTNAQAEAAAEALAAASPVPGYTCFGGPGNGVNATNFGAWIPGAGATLFPAGTGVRYSGGRKLIVQMHYNVPASGGPFTDRSTVKLQLSSDTSLTPAILMLTGAPQISLPPNDADATASGDVPLASVAQHLNLPSINGFRVWGVLPHMHTTGKTQLTVANAPNGPQQCLTNVDRWNFHWQNLWWYDAPIEVSVDSTIHLTCDYDTRGRTQTTVFGEGTSDEMCMNALYVTTY